MKAVVIKKYKDKESKKIMEVGTEIELSEERFAEILAAGEYVKKIADHDNPQDQNSNEDTLVETPKKRGGRKGKE